VSLRAAAALVALAASGARGDPLPSQDPAFRVDVEVSGLGATTDLAFLPDGRMLVTEKDGTLRIVNQGTAREVHRFAVDTHSEKGLLGVLVDPDFARNRRVILYLSAADSAGGTDLDRNRVIAVTLGPDDRVVAGSEKVLLRGLRGPANHDGGALALGPDGMLYVGVGDTGCNSGRDPEPPYDPTNYFATCLSNANGKILRIGLDGSIPADNPLVGVARATACGARCSEDVLRLPPAAPRREIWAWGLRNPWRFAFDPVTGLLWVGDVGEVTWEELTIVEKGRHHGWPWREGRHGWPTSKCREVRPDAGDCVEPVYECDRDQHAHQGADVGCRSITGGEFLAGPRWPEAQRRRYVFGDNVTRQLWSIELTHDRRGVVKGSRRDLAKAPGLPVSFRRGPGGDLYVAVLPGKVLRISPASP
jgi:glucose/arabinose dehydrogenase